MVITKYKKVTLLCFGIIFVILPISPISSEPTLIEKPDLLICLIFAWIITDSKNDSLGYLIFLSFFADIMWYRPLGLWPVLIVGCYFLVKSIMTKISIENFFLKVLYFILFLLVIDTCIYLTSLIGLTEQLDFNVWMYRFVFTILAFTIIAFLLELLKNNIIRNSKSKNY